MGGEDYQGLYITFFTLAALLSRPISGQLADYSGRLPVMYFGALVCVITCLFYPIFPTVFAFLTLRFIHGVSTGFNPTGLSAYLADIIPLKKRGEAMGILGLFTSTGMAIGPSIGPLIAEHYGRDMMFYASSLMAAISMIILLGLPETLPNKRSIGEALKQVSFKNMFEPEVLPSALVYLLTLFSFGAILTMIPDYTLSIGIGNKGIFFTIFTASSLFVRLLAGKASDKHGRIPLIQIATMGIVLSMLILALWPTITGFYIAAVVYGLAIGINSPTLYAWTVDLSHPERRGRGMGTMFMGLEIGIGLGAWLAGSLYTTRSFALPFFICAALSLIAFFYLVWFRHKKSGETSVPPL